ncbi:hypothetical protein INS49_013021 [Diaporthe citri]|uniref:uncharacterized protein n=1 Tax=Diaporthe citri TaxID=83186 RepID=UPI001C804407|nr:uncharacterized protein INS49_013021 [Diaporthe citri]KAG6359500.1 hypothetical protein INS49_013021 [Diaporthe citri]
MAAQRVTEAPGQPEGDTKAPCKLGDAPDATRAADDDGTLAANPFADPAVAEHYRAVYEKAQYECRHAFDPELEWSRKEERGLVRRLDWHVCTWACIMCFALQVDRDNLGQAVSGNMLDQLGLSTNEYNYGRTIYYISFLLSEVPSQLVSKKFGPDRWIPVQMVLWAVSSLASFFLMPASAVQTRTWFRPHGWFTDREERIVVNRVLRDDPSKGDMHNRMPITPRRLWQAVTDYDLWPLYAMATVIFIPTNPPEHYLTLTLRELGFDPFITNLLVIPSTAIGILTLLAITWVSEHVDERAFVSMVQGIWSLPCLLALRFWPGTMVDAWGTYALVTVLLSFPYCQAIVVGWTSKNSGSVRTRAISASVFSMMKQVGSISSSNIYREDDKPLYHRGNGVLIGINLLAIGLFLFTKCYYVLRNRWKARRWDSMSEAERKEYLDFTKDQGNKRLDFKFAH